MSRLRLPVVLIVAALLPNTPTWAQLGLEAEHPGDTADDRWGETVAILGDVDADGHRDYAIASPWVDGEIAGLPVLNLGMVRVFSGATDAVLYEWTGAGFNADDFGYTVCDGGDVNGDGHADIVIAAPKAGNTGRIDVRSGATGQLLRTIFGSQPHARFGHALALTRDFDGDGVRDMAVGSPYEHSANTFGSSTSPGFMRVVSLVTGQVSVSMDGLSPLYVGPAVPEWQYQRVQWGASIVDVDGHLLIGAPESKLLHVPSGGGSSTVLLNGAGLVLHMSLDLFSISWARMGAVDYDRMGTAIAAPGGDLTGDGVAEVLVGVPGRDVPGVVAGGGAVEVLDGATGLPVHTVTGSDGEFVGGTLAGTGDVDGDGLPDFAVSVVTSDVAGRVQVHSGADLAVLHESTGNQPGAHHGQALAGGDLDGDGLGDLLVGAPWESLPGGGSAAGLAQVYGSACAANSFFVGDGLAGTFGKPRLLPRTEPLLGQTLELDVTNTATVPTVGWLVLGLVELTLPFKGGTLHTVPLLNVAVPLPVTPAALSLPLPADDSLCGAVLMLQFLVQDAGAPVGFAISHGVGLTLGH